MEPFSTFLECSEKIFYTLDLPLTAVVDRATTAALNHLARHSDGMGVPARELYQEGS